MVTSDAFPFLPGGISPREWGDCLLSFCCRCGVIGGSMILSADDIVAQNKGDIAMLF
jgi:hypothetical protein